MLKWASNCKEGGEGERKVYYLVQQDWNVSLQLYEVLTHLGLVRVQARPPSFTSLGSIFP